MTDPIKLICKHLEDLIQDAETRVGGNGSILDYGMKVRRDTAEEVLRFVQAQLRTDRRSAMKSHAQYVRSRTDGVDVGSLAEGSARRTKASASDARAAPPP